MRKITVIAVEKGPRPRKTTKRRVLPDRAVPGDNELLIIPGADGTQEPRFVDPTLPTYEEFDPPLTRIAGGRIHEVKAHTASEGAKAR